MFRSANRPLGTLALLLLLVPSTTGCLTTRHLPFDSNAPRLVDITGVSMRSGQEIRFSAPGASITNDTLYAMGKAGQLLLPTDSIAQVSTRKMSAVRTVGLVAGLAVVGLAIAAAVSLRDFHPFGNTP